MRPRVAGWGCRRDAATSGRDAILSSARGGGWACVQVRAVLGHQLLQLKNPWAKLRWKGAFSATDTRWQDERLRKALNYDPAAAMQTDNGVFWIDCAWS